MSRTDMAETASTDRVRRGRNRLRLVGPLVQFASMLGFGCFDGEATQPSDEAGFSSLARWPRQVPLSDGRPVAHHPNRPIQPSAAAKLVVSVGLAARPPATVAARSARAFSTRLKPWASALYRRELMLSVMCRATTTVRLGQAARSPPMRPSVLDGELVVDAERPRWDCRG